MKLHSIIRDTKGEIAAAKKLRSIGDLKRMIRDASPVRSFKDALGKGFGVIAEIKKRSPSAGDMRQENVSEAPAAYAKSPIVRAVSVLTNSTHFGMSIEDLQKVKDVVWQPILRKDFISTEYQIYEARAFGADAILLMANVLNADELKQMFAKARELGLEVLFESHTQEEIDSIPEGAEIYGINSRKFMASNRWLMAKFGSKWLEEFGSRFFGKSGKSFDPTVELNVFSALAQHLPKHAIKVAESGIKPSKISNIMDLGYDSVLVGTSLLKSQEGIKNSLFEFEQAIDPVRSRAVRSSVVVSA